MKFSEEWLAEYEARKARTKPLPVKKFPQQPLEAIYVPPAIVPPPASPAAGCQVFRLVAPLPLLNVWERMHWRARKAYKVALRAEVLQLITPPAAPIEHAVITIWRHSVRAPDADNLIAKSLLDVLQPQSKRHPYGIGMIAGDDPAHLTYRIEHVQERHLPAQHTLVKICEAA